MPKPKESIKVSKMPTKNLNEKETPFDPVLYETKDASSSIVLLNSPEKEIVTRALYQLSRYSDEKETNLNFLYEKGIIPQLVRFIQNPDVIITRFSLKILGQIVSVVPEAAMEMSKKNEVKEINEIFIKTSDSFIKEFCAQILSKTLNKNTILASELLKPALIATIFITLRNEKDLDTQQHLFHLILSLLSARDAKSLIPKIAEFSPKILMCYVKSANHEIQSSIMSILQTITDWKNDQIQKIFRPERLGQEMLLAIMNHELQHLHKEAFKILENSLQCNETASDLLRNVEFLEFCQWAKTCKNPWILPSVNIFTILSGHSNIRQILFDFGVEETILSFFRSAEDESVFCKTCQGVINMSNHYYCCKKLITPSLITVLLNVLKHDKASIIPCKEIAIKTLCEFMQKEYKTLELFVNCKGISPLSSLILKGPQHYTEEGYNNLLDILYLLAYDPDLRKTIMDKSIYVQILKLFKNNSVEQSKKALIIMNLYVDESESREYFLESNGPQLILKTIRETPDEELFKNLLVFMERIFLYKRTGMAFLHSDCLSILKALPNKLHRKLPITNRLENMMYNLYLPMKFHQTRTLEVSDRLRNRFYLVRENTRKDLPFIDIMENLYMSSIDTIYIIDFSGVNQCESLPRPIRQSLKKIRKPKLWSKKGSKSSTTSSLLITEKTSSAINYGSISSDPYLIEYVRELQKKLFSKEKGTICFNHQVKILAKFVHAKLSGEFGMEKRCCIELHINNLKHKLGYSVIPIGYLRCGGYCEKSLLFKTLADRIGLPCTLRKDQHSVYYWNEIPLHISSPYSQESTKTSFVTYCVVDLMEKIGNFMIVGSLEADKYCGFVN